MKKLFCLCFISIFLFSCSKFSQELYLLIDNINEAENIMVYSYKEKYKEFKKLDHYEVINSLSEIEFDLKYTIINIDCSLYYDELTSEFMDELMNILEGNHKVIINFINSKNYEFIRFTQFSLESYRRGDEYVKSIKNLAGLKVVDFNITTKYEKEKNQLAIVSIISAELGLGKE